MKPNLLILGANNQRDVPGLSTVENLVNMSFTVSEEDMPRALPEADILFGWDFRAKTLETHWPSARRLKWIHWAGAGVDAAMFPRLVQSEVQLTNAKGIFDDAMAEYVLGLVLSMAKGFPRTYHSQIEKLWDYRCNESIANKTALIVGAGSIGRAIGRKLGAMDMKLSAIARSPRENDPIFGQVHGIKDLAILLPHADYVINITPATPDTHLLFGEKEFSLMKSQARFINVGRGISVDESALVQALEKAQIAEAALDVYQTEPLPEHSPLWSTKNLIISPHMSGDIDNYEQLMVDQFIDNLKRFLNDEPLFNVVDKHKGY